MNVLLFYLAAFLNLGYYIFIYGFIDITFNFVIVFDYKLSIFYFFLLFIFILCNQRTNQESFAAADFLTQYFGIKRQKLRNSLRSNSLIFTVFLIKYC